MNKETNKKIAGVKFFQHHLDLLKLFRYEYVDHERTEPLPASAIVTYILYHYQCDDYGRIPADDFCLKALAEKYNLPYTSLHNGHHILLKYELIRSVHIYNQEYYEITGYEECNNVERKEGNLNYFILPYFVLESGELAEFIRHRDPNGLLELLTLINSLYRNYQRKRNKTSRIERLATTLMANMKKTTRNILAWIERASAFLRFSEQSGKSRRKKKWVIELVEECFDHVDQDPQLAALIVKIRKDITAFFTQSSLHYNKNDIQDVLSAAKQDLIHVFYPLTKFDEWQRLAYSLVMKSHMDALEQLRKRIALKDNPLQKVGAYYRRVLQSAVKEYWKNTLNQNHRIEILHHFGTTGTKLPAFLEK